MKNNENQSKQYAIPMEVTNETIRDFGIDPRQVVWTKIGNKKVRAFMVPCTEEQYYEYMRPLWREDKNAQNRQAMESLEKMADDLDFDPSAAFSVEESVVGDMVLEALIDHLNSLGSEYGDIFRLIYNGGKTDAVQEAFGLKKSTAIHRMKRARELAAEFISE